MSQGRWVRETYPQFTTEIPSVPRVQGYFSKSHLTPLWVLENPPHQWIAPFLICRPLQFFPTGSCGVSSLAWRRRSSTKHKPARAGITWKIHIVWGRGIGTSVVHWYWAEGLRTVRERHAHWELVGMRWGRCSWKLLPSHTEDILQPKIWSFLGNCVCGTQMLGW